MLQQQEQPHTLTQLQTQQQQQQQEEEEPASEASASEAVSGSMELVPVVKVQTESDAADNVRIQFDEKGQKSYKCEICAKVLQSKYNLKRHNVSPPSQI